MSTIDLSRAATDFRKHFTSVRAQMGRVLTDDDHNENERLHAEDERRINVDVIGPAGAPDDGFLVKNPHVAANGKIDFDISAGSFYLGGNRLELENVEPFQLQSDWLNMASGDMPDPPANTSRFDLVFLETWQQPVSAVEDNELFEVALGGPDTSQRLRQVRRVRVAPGAATGDCGQGWANLIAQWSAAGLGKLNDQDELSIDTQLTVGFDPGGNKNDLCTPPVAGGYLGAENQAIRVQLVDGTHFTWGFDNAAPLYRVTVGPNNVGQKRQVTMLTDPKDQAHWPVAGQVVEILPWSSVLPNGQKTSGTVGFLARVDVSYDPDSKQFYLAADLPAGFGEQWLTRSDAAALQPEFFYLRVWNRGGDVTSAVSIPFVTGTPVTLKDTGLLVTFTGTDRRPGDFWIIAARPESPNVVVPWVFESGRGPHGIRRFYAPLAIIQWSAGGPASQGTVVRDCRETFLPLTRLRGCCTYTVGDGNQSFGAFSKIQDAINALPAAGGCVCLLPGVYKQNAEIVNRHDIELHGCGRRTVWQDGSDGKLPVLTIRDSQGITVRDLAIEAPQVLGIQLASTKAAEANNAGLSSIHLHHLKVTARDVGAIECRGGQFIQICRTWLVALELPGGLGPTFLGKAPLVFIRADDVVIEENHIAALGRRPAMAAGGVHIGGGSERVEIRRNQIVGGNGNGITLGSVTFSFQIVDPAPLGIIEFFPFFNFFIDANGCLQVDPDPQDPIDPGGNTLTPASDGDLSEIRILDNDILSMGLNGISTLRYFKNGIGPIIVRGLEVSRNIIRKCLRVELGPTPFGKGPQVGFGGVSLHAVEEFTLRGNWIESNGKNFVDPACGVFVTSARGFHCESNMIVDNGPLAVTQQQATAGPRGGIVVQFAAAPVAPAAAFPKLSFPREGYPAARVAGNIVIAPLGRALSMGAWGTVAVEANELTSLGVERTNPIGATVGILNLGVTYEIAGLLVGLANLGKNQAKIGAIQMLFTLLGGKTLFNDNQVLLAPQGPGDVDLGSSIFIVTADDVMIDGNQSECRLVVANALVNTQALGWSLRMTGNRFEEKITAPGLSGFTWGAFNNTSDNQGTRCFAAVGFPALSARVSNRSLISVFLPTLCADFTAALKAKLQSTGLDA